MSLHVLANHMSSKGRNGDSMLVHMTPNEVQGLQALAMKHGGSLTINPDTGLPEANFLKKLLPLIAGFALGPAGMGIAFGGLSSAASAGLLVGGVTGLATGSLSKGLMAGLGAYGGAGLGGGLESAGSASIGSAAEGIQGPIGSPESGFGATQAIAAAPKADVLSAGFNAATASPTAAMNFAKANMMPLAAAAAPIAADMMVPTTTKMPENKNPAYIRQKRFDPISQTYTSMDPVLASEWGARNFSDAYAKPMAGGGIVALAEGGVSATDYFLANPDVAKAYNEDIGGYAKGLTAQQFADQHYANFGQAEKRFVNPGLQVDPNQTAAAQQYLNDPKNADVLAYLSSQAGKDYLAANPQFDASDVAYTHFKRYGEREGRQFGLPSVVPGDVKLDTATTYDNGAFGNYGSGDQTGKDYQGNTVSIATPGDVITNPDNSRTVTPNLPGRPYGGFTGIENIKSAYTAGGGSLGYTPYIPTTPEEHDKLYNTQGSDSLAAYNYLIGKGAGTPGAAKYPTKSGVGEIMRPYKEATLGVPVNLTSKKYLWDNETRTYKLNPDYIAPQTQAEKTTAAATTAKAGKPSTISVVDSSGYNTETITATLQNDGTYLGNNNKRYDASGKELAAMGGMMGYAVGGGLGSLGSYSDGGRLLKGPGDGVSDSIPATIGAKQQPARLADGEFVVPARIVSELGNGSTEAGARKLYAMMDRVQKARGKTTGKNKVAANSRADKYLPA
jgi:hypothetical protein